MSNISRSNTHQLKSELTTNIASQLVNWEAMPSNSYIRLPIVKALYGLSSASVWRFVKSGKIPAPVKISERVTAWNVGAIKADLAAKADA